MILGGSSGIGFGVAEGAMREGARVVIGSTNKEKVDAAVAPLGTGASGFAVDVRDETSLKEFFSRVGAFEHLVFTAGDAGRSYAIGPVAQMDLASAGEAARVRFWGALAAIKHSQATLAPNGSVTLTDGVLAQMPMKGAFLATAFAGTVQHLVRGRAMDLAPIRVNSVCPGLIFTERVVLWGEENIRKATQQLPIPRAGAVHEAAEAYLYLMRGSYTTGQTLIVDGGRTLV